MVERAVVGITTDPEDGAVLVACNDGSVFIWTKGSKIGWVSAIPVPGTRAALETHDGYRGDPQEPPPTP